MSAPRIVILGAGTGGTMVANRLRRRLEPDEAEIHVVDRDDRHVYQPGLLFVPFGLAHLDEIFRPRRRQLHSGITFHETAIDSVSLDRQSVRLEDGSDLPYDVLVVATGTRLQPEETEGLTGPGWNERAFTFYTAPGAEALREPLEWFDGGRLVVNVVDMPIKCPARRSSSCSSPTGTCGSAGSAARRSSCSPRRSTAPSPSRWHQNSSARCSTRRESSSSRSSTRARSTGPAACWPRTTGALSTSTCW
jgi:hypothetical protein